MAVFVKRGKYILDVKHNFFFSFLKYQIEYDSNKLSTNLGNNIFTLQQLEPKIRT